MNAATQKIVKNHEKDFLNPTKSYPHFNGGTYSFLCIIRWAYVKFNYMHLNLRESLVLNFYSKRNKSLAYIQSKWPLLFMLYYITTLKSCLLCLCIEYPKVFLKLNSQSKSKNGFIIEHFSEIPCIYFERRGKFYFYVYIMLRGRILHMYLCCCICMHAMRGDSIFCLWWP